MRRIARVSTYRRYTYDRQLLSVHTTYSAPETSAQQNDRQELAAKEVFHVLKYQRDIQIIIFF